MVCSVQTSRHFCNIAVDIRFLSSWKHWPVVVVVKDIAICVGCLGFDSLADQIGRCRHRCDVSVLPMRNTASII